MSQKANKSVTLQGLFSAFFPALFFYIFGTLAMSRKILKMFFIKLFKRLSSNFYYQNPEYFSYLQFRRKKQVFILFCRNPAERQ